MKVYVMPNRRGLNFLKWLWLRFLRKPVVSDGNIQQAIDSLPQEGGTVFLLNGTYDLISFDIVYVKDKVSLTGAVPNVKFTSSQRGKPTPRQLDILYLVAEGYSNREIAVALHLSENTIKNQLAEAIIRLGARDRTSAVILAIQRGYLDLFPPGKKRK